MLQEHTIQTEIESGSENMLHKDYLNAGNDCYERTTSNVWSIQKIKNQSGVKQQCEGKFQLLVCILGNTATNILTYKYGMILHWNIDV